MKFKTTQKEIRKHYRAIVPVGYCSLYYLLSHTDPIAYTAGVYGWNADIYDINGVALVTGYRPFGNIKVDYEIVRHYEKLAETAYKDTLLSYDDRMEIIDDLLIEFRNEVLKA